MWLLVSFINGNTRKKLFPVLSLNAWGTLFMMIAGISYPRRSTGGYFQPLRLFIA
jgi:hypothetical protein